jgi:transcriptional regulator with XRE-family HTH domain
VAANSLKRQKKGMIEENSIGEQQSFAGNMQHVGEYIRQERRQLNLTQSSLGQTRYSKSYVSAVERNKIIPSLEALRFFAEQMGQPSDYFKKVLEQTEQLRTTDLLHSASPSAMGERLFPARDLTFLNILLDKTEHPNLQAFQEYSTLTAEFVASLPLEQQASYIFLMGLIAQEKRDLVTARSAFERAFALVSPKQQPVILDELGHNYYLQHYYQMALHYHLRVLNLLENDSAEECNSPLQFKVELHCGNDYQALGAYEQAAAMYERARTHLNTTHELKTAGVLYFGLGYCIYAHMRQLAAQTESQRSTPEEIQAQYQQAIGFLVQSRSVYHVSNDHQSEALARLTLAQAELDLSS